MAKVVTDDKHYKDIAARIKGYDTVYVDTGVKPEDMPDGVDAVFQVGKNEGYTEAKIDENNAYLSGVTAGKKAEYDRFWDAYQENGERTNYAFAFPHRGWTDETFTPKHDLILAGSQGSMFNTCNITDLVKILRDRNVAFSTADATDMRQMFQAARLLTTIPELDLRKCTSLLYTFQSCGALYRIEKIISAETTPFTSTTFQGLSTLVDVVFEGVIGVSIDLRWCPLSRASLTSVANALLPTATATLHVKKTAVDAAFPDRTEWDALFADKPNWTITEV